MDNNNNKMRNWFLIGLGAGAVAGYLLNTDKGREIRHDAQEKISDASHQLAETAKNKMDDFRQGTEQILEDSKHYVDDITTKLKSRFAAAGDAVEDMGDEYKKGVRRAKANMARADERS